MKVIFLDIDGVICTPFSFRLTFEQGREDQLFDPISLFYLRRLVRKTGAKIVLSSSWRDAIMAEEKEYHAIIENLFLALQKNKTPICDVTPQSEHGKGVEIQNWLQCNQVDQYVIFDDTNFFDETPEVKEHWIFVNDEVGLRKEEYLKAVKMLK